MGAALFAEKITAQQADAWGMIWEAVPDAEFDRHWRARAAHLAAGPTATYAAIKSTLRDTWAQDFDGQFAVEARAQGRVGKSRDFKEGVLAFTEKRRPQFEGR
jgi:2-(1,2-epoxy-1,2-dihydrophenyl)acetyl-CoA isomerase